MNRTGLVVLVLAALALGGCVTNNLSARLAGANGKFAAGDLQGSMQDYKVLLRDPKLADDEREAILVNYAAALIDRGNQLDEAEEKVRAAIELNDRNRTAHVLFVRILAGRGDNEAALRHWEQLKGAGQDSETLALGGDLYLRQRRPRAALNHYDEALERGLNGAAKSRVMKQRAVALALLKDYDEALRSFRAYLQSRPKRYRMTRDETKFLVFLGYINDEPQAVGDALATASLSEHEKTTLLERLNDPSFVTRLRLN